MQYRELCNIKIGTRVTFTRPWDIFPIMVIPEGTTGVVHDSDDLVTYIMPDDMEIRALLKEWDGCIAFYPEDAEPTEYELPISLTQ